MSAKSLKKMVPRGRVELPTHGFSAACPRRKNNHIAPENPSNGRPVSAAFDGAVSNEFGADRVFNGPAAEAYLDELQAQFDALPFNHRNRGLIANRIRAVEAAIDAASGL